MDWGWQWTQQCPLQDTHAHTQSHKFWQLWQVLLVSLWRNLSMGKTTSTERWVTWHVHVFDSGYQGLRYSTWKGGQHRFHYPCWRNCISSQIITLSNCILPEVAFTLEAVAMCQLGFTMSSIFHGVLYWTFLSEKLQVRHLLLWTFVWSNHFMFTRILCVNRCLHKMSI